MNIRKIRSNTIRNIFIDTIIATTILTYSCQKEDIEPDIPPKIYTGIMWKDVRNEFFDKGYKLKFLKENNTNEYNPTNMNMYDAQFQELVTKANIINWNDTLQIAYILGNKNLGDSAEIYRKAFQVNKIPSVVIRDADLKTPNQVSEEVLSYMRAAKYIK